MSPKKVVLTVLTVPGILSSYTFIRDAPASWCHLEISDFYLKEICLRNVIPLVFWVYISVKTALEELYVNPLLCIVC